LDEKHGAEQSQTPLRHKGIIHFSTSSLQTSFFFNLTVNKKKKKMGGGRRKRRTSTENHESLIINTGMGNKRGVDSEIA